MIYKNFDSITFDDINDLIEGGVRESRTLDFKRDLPGDTHDDKKEFLQDIASFAFAGGDIVYGLGEKKDDDERNTGTPIFVGLPADLNVERTEQRLLSIINDGLRPRLHAVNIKFLDAPDKKKVCVLRIPKSWANPHMVTKSSSSFFTRTAAGNKVALDVDGIRDAFLASLNIGNKVQEYRNNRIGLILSDEIPVKLTSIHRVVMHTIPLQTYGDSSTIDIDPFATSPPYVPNRSLSFSSRYNLEGLLVYCLAGSDSYSYHQFYRDGRVEVVDGTLIHGRENGRPVIAHKGLEDNLIYILECQLSFLRNLRIEPPVVVMLSLLNVKGAKLSRNVHGFLPEGDCQITERNLLLPELLVTDLQRPGEELLKPLFDQIWNAAGHPRSLNYSVDGKRIPGN